MPIFLPTQANRMAYEAGNEYVKSLFPDLDAAMKGKCRTGEEQAAFLAAMLSGVAGALAQVAGCDGAQEITEQLAKTFSTPEMAEKIERIRDKLKPH